MRPELRPHFDRLAETYYFEPRSRLWVELLAGLLYQKENEPERFTDDAQELLATMLKDLPPRR